MKRIVVLLVVLTLASFLAFSQGPVYLNMGSTSSSSGVYAWCVAAANATSP